MRAIFHLREYGLVIDNEIKTYETHIFVSKNHFGFEKKKYNIDGHTKCPSFKNDCNNQTYWFICNKKHVSIVAHQQFCGEFHCSNWIIKNQAEKPILNLRLKDPL